MSNDDVYDNPLRDALKDAQAAWRCVQLEQAKVKALEDSLKMVIEQNLVLTEALEYYNNPEVWGYFTLKASKALAKLQQK